MKAKFEREQVLYMLSIGLLILYISVSINSNTGNLLNPFVYNDEPEIHLPIPVYSYIQPDMGTQFILHFFYTDFQ